MAVSSGARRVFLHIGPPKTGTTYLQSILRQNRQALRRAGVLVPDSRPGFHFEAASDLRGRARRPGSGRRVEGGAWDRLAADVRDWPGTSVVSSEWLAFSDDDQVARAARSFDPVEVNVVLTLRDLGRLVPAVWQEQVKNGKDFTMSEFLDQLNRPETHAYGATFWRVHDTRLLAGSWQAHVPAERIHLVTVPSGDAAPDELWSRFASLFVGDPQAYDLDGVRSNPGLGPADAELLRQVNAELGGRLRKPAHTAMVKRLLVDSLVAAGRSGRILLPAEALEDVARRADEVVTELALRGYPVSGDLADLTVRTQGSATILPEDAAPDDVRRAAVTSLATLLTTMQAAKVHRRHLAKRGRSSASDADAAMPVAVPLGRATGRRAIRWARRAARRARRVRTRG